jgi:phage baseplate assembly protein W
VSPVARRNPEQLDLLMRQLGRDLALDYAGPGGMWEDADLVVEPSPNRWPSRKDLAVASGVDAAAQTLVNRLKTQRGELASLGHPDYGSRHHELIGEPNVERTRNLVKLHVLEALTHEPRVEKVLSVQVTAPHDPPRSDVRIELDLQLVGEPAPLNLVVPFSFGVES